MCGVVALLVRGPDAGDVRQRLDRALSLMAARGPDDAGTYVATGQSGAAGSGVGMCRLRVRSDPADEVPFHHSGTSTVHAFNGEVYGALGGDSWSPVPGGASEALTLHEPERCPDGMWASVTLGPDGVAHVRRDPWGIKPLWMRADEHETMVASTVSVLADRVRPTVRSEGVAQFLSYGRVADGGSLWHRIRPVPRGARRLSDVTATEPEVVFDQAVHKARRDLVEPDGTSTLDVVVRSAVRDSVAATMESDRPLGLALSGGLDSTIIAHHARELGHDELRTISIRTTGCTDGVVSLADLPLPGSAPGGWVHHARTVRAADYLKLLERSVIELGQPTSLTSTPLYLALADTAAEAGVTVLVVGEGADEVWGGYRSYLEVTEHTSPEDFYLSPRRIELLSGLLPTDELEHARQALRDALPRGRGPRAVMAAERDFSLGPLLERTDAMMMSQSIEARTPFLHGTGWAVAGELPWAAKVGDGQTKRALRSAYRAELPSFADEVKQPFRAPWARWLTDDLALEVTALVGDSPSHLRALGIRPAAALDVVRRGIAGDAAAASLSFSLCSLVLWKETQK